MRVSTVEDLLGPEAIEALFRPTVHALGLPGRSYTDEAFFRLENERLFPRLWTAAGVASDIPEPGDAVPASVAGRPLILARGEDARVRAFYNICRHRGSQILATPQRRLTALRCPYHGWRYDLEGRLTATPHLGGKGEDTTEGLDRSKLGLKEVPTDVLLNTVFVNLDGNAPPLEEHMTPFLERYSAYDLPALRHGGTAERDIEANWKLVIEGAVEDYHIDQLHAQLFGEGTHWESRVVNGGGDCFAAISAHFEEGQDVTLKDGGLPPFPGSPDDSWETAGVVGLFPNIGFFTTPTHILINLLVPLEPHRTRLRTDYYFCGEAAVEQDLAEDRQQVFASWKRIWDQDQEMLEVLQRMHGARDAAGIANRFSPAWEGSVHRFQRFVVESLLG
jgi:choline monooxygenase